MIIERQKTNEESLEKKSVFFKNKNETNYNNSNCGQKFEYDFLSINHSKIWFF